MKLDPYTYGKSPAAVNLSKMICEHPNAKVINRKVGRLFDSVNYKMNQIEVIKDDSLIENIHTLILKDVEENHLNFLYRDGFRPGPRGYRVEESELESKIATHIMNVLRSRYKAWHRGERDGIVHVEHFNETTDIHRRVDGKHVIYIRSPKE